MKTISDLRTSMFDVIEKLKSGKMDIETAKAVAQVGQVVVESAKLEVDYIRAIGAGKSSFLADSPSATALELSSTGGSITRIGNKTIHRMN